MKAYLTNQNPWLRGIFDIPTFSFFWDSLASIVTILLSFEAILKMVSVRIIFQLQSNDLPQALKYIKIAPRLTSIVTMLVNIALSGEQIFQALAQYSCVLPQYLGVLSR